MQTLANQIDRCKHTRIMQDRERMGQNSQFHRLSWKRSSLSGCTDRCPPCLQSAPLHKTAECEESGQKQACWSRFWNIGGVHGEVRKVGWPLALLPMSVKAGILAVMVLGTPNIQVVELLRGWVLGCFLANLVVGEITPASLGSETPFLPSSRSC